MERRVDDERGEAGPFGGNGKVDGERGLFSAAFLADNCDGGYASATQIGVESGLTLASTARTIAADPTVRTGHLFSFGQSLSN